MNSACLTKEQSQALAVFIKREAKALGFDACGIAAVSSVGEEKLYFQKWLDANAHAGMEYMANNQSVRFNPSELLTDARSVISVALNYYPARLLSSDTPHVAYYAYGKDYHVVIKKKLRELWHLIESYIADQNLTLALPAARAFTDSVPLLERYWAWKAGLGWIGKNTQLILPGKGSYFFLGEIVTTLPLPVDEPIKNRCGSCTRCLSSCPTGALERPRFLNANKCISYLTIENRNDIPESLAPLLGNRLFGCDTCQQVCPWNKFATPNQTAEFAPRESLFELKKELLKHFSIDDYNRIFAGSAVKRAKYEGIIRTINNLLKDHEKKI